jgi:hypothetical protein
MFPGTRQGSSRSLTDRHSLAPHPNNADWLSARALKQLFCWPAAILLLFANNVTGQSLPIEEISLPTFLIEGHPARAHTQGLEVIDRDYYITARREDVRPKRALLLRTHVTATNWQVWDITPRDQSDSTLDHPGGMQSVGGRLWIPVAESKPKSHSLIRVFALPAIAPSQPLKSEFDFPVNDHIGAVAVSSSQNVILGANWDTESVYVWDMQGHLKLTLTGSALALRGLGAGHAADRGIAVQDWKVMGVRLFASGLVRDSGIGSNASKSRLASFTHFLEPDFQRSVVNLPFHKNTELAREAMAISNGTVLFLPEDLGVSNRIFRVALTNLY